MNGRWVIVLVVSFLFMAFNQEELPKVKTKAQAEVNWEKKVELIGEYKVMMLPTSKRPGSKLMRSSRVEIRMGKFSIALERDKEGIRDTEEMKKFEGKKVKVIGTIHSMVNLWGDGTEQSIVMPAIVNIEALQLLK